MGLTRSDRWLISAAVLATATAGLTRYLAVGGHVGPFVLAAIALAVLASLVGRSVDALGDRLGAGATGVIQSALGNLPELFVSLFALRDGLLLVAQASIVGSVLANVLLVLGLAFVAGGARHGELRFDTAAARTVALLLLLSVVALTVPSITAALGARAAAAAAHERGLSIAVSILLLVLFAASLPASTKRIARGAGDASPKPAEWPLPAAIVMLAVAGVGAAFVSDWFVVALAPAIKTLGISQAFAGLVIVAIAGNAVENVVGIQLALRNQTDYALSVILQSPLQIALVLAPALVLLSPLVGASFTLVLPPLLIVMLLIAVLVTLVVVVDGQANWLEGLTLLVLYGIIATAFWWG